MQSKRIIFILLALLIVAIGLNGIELEKGTEDLNRALAEGIRSEEFIPVIINLKDHLDTKTLYNRVKNLPKAERRDVTITTLKEHSFQSQKGLRNLLESYQKKGLVTTTRYHWLTNAIGSEVTLKVLKELDQLPEIESIKYDPLQHVLIEPVSEEKFDPETSERTLPYNVSIIGAPEAWQDGFRGQGVVVGVIDTGVNYNHIDLKDIMWTNDDFPYHGYDFVNDDNDPMDDHRHGTHCAGTVAGTGAAGQQVGVAPKAQIMALKGLDRSGNGRESWIWGSLEFGAEHGADVLSMSLGWTHKASPSKTLWREAMDNLLSAGVIVSVAAGNEGDEQPEHPIPQNVRTPGDCPPPWLSPEMPLREGISGVITTGASDETDFATFFTSLGPVTWQDVAQYNDYPYNPGEGLMKPDIIAPGWYILSCEHSSNDGYVLMSGTSMATPATSGLIALMLNKDQDLTPEKVCEILETTARKYGEKSNLSGSGRIDVPSAMNALINEKEPGKPYIDYPANKSKEILLDARLSWLKNMQTTTYTLYLGTDNPPTNVIDGLDLDVENYSLDGLLEFDTEYFWRVDAKNEHGQIEGELWSFRTVLPISVDFESGDFGIYEWEFYNSGQDAQNWTVSDKYAYEGEYSIRSGEIKDGSYTTLSLILRVKEDGIISFFKKISSEDKSDFLRFQIDGNIVGEWSGESDWERVYFLISAGMRSIRWTYSKDTMNSAGEDTVWLDNITFPRHQKPAMVYTPESLQFDFDYEAIKLSWELEENEDVNPIEFLLFGFNVYGGKGDDEELELLNEGYITDNEYVFTFNEADDYRFAVTAVYRIMGKVVETELSEEMSVAIQPAIEAPAITPESGEYNEPITVSIEAEEAEIFYTLDGTEPTFESTPFDEPFKLEESAVIKAIAYKLGALPSEIITAEYSIVLTGVEEEILPPAEFAINLYPNPVSKSKITRSAVALNIEMAIPKEINRLTIEIYNIKGQLIRDYELHNVGRGVQLIQWDLKNNQGKETTNGIYFLKFNTDNETKHKRVMVVK